MTLWRVRNLVSVIIGVLLVTAPLAQGGDHWTREISAEPGNLLKIELHNGGSLEIHGWDRSVVRISCNAMRSDRGYSGIKIVETSGGLSLDANLSDLQINNSSVFRIMVPRRFDVEIRSGGDISITGVTGEFRGKTTGGDLILRDIKGKAQLSTDGGIIEVTDSELDGWVTSAGGGGIAHNLVGDLTVTSSGGAVSFKNVRTRSGEFRVPQGLSSHNVSAETVTHSISGGEIALADAPAGAKVFTGGGDIRINNASRFVAAETGGGNITIEIEAGWVVAKTGTGDIEIIVTSSLGDTGEGMDLYTGLGEVTVTLPADASIQLDLDLAYTRMSSQDYKIDSDFDLSVEQTSNWDNEFGYPRKHIYGTATINGGKHRVTINCLNGNIRLIKK